MDLFYNVGLLRRIVIGVFAIILFSCGGRVYLPTTYFIPPSTANDYTPNVSVRNEIFGGLIGAQFKDETGFMFGMQSGIYATGELLRGGVWVSGWYGQYLYAENTPVWKQTPGFQLQGLVALAPVLSEGENVKRLEIGLWGGIGMEGVEDSQIKYEPVTGRTVESGTQLLFYPLPTGGLAIGYQVVHNTDWAMMMRYYIGLGGGLAFSFRHKERFEVGLSTQMLSFMIRPDMPPARLSIAFWID